MARTPKAIVRARRAGDLQVGDLLYEPGLAFGISRVGRRYVRMLGDVVDLYDDQGRPRAVFRCDRMVDVRVEQPRLW